MSKLWTIKETHALKDIAGLGVQHVAFVLGRSEDAVRKKARELNISLDIDSQVKGWTWIDAEMAQRIRDYSQRDICPHCGKRRITVEATGLCGPCHYDIIIEAKTLSLDMEVRKRRMDLLRKHRERLRLCEECGTTFYPRTSSKQKLCPTCRQCYVCEVRHRG